MDLIQLKRVKVGLQDSPATHTADVDFVYLRPSCSADRQPASYASFRVLKMPVNDSRSNV